MFVHFGEAQGVRGTEVWSLFKDQKGRIWFPSEGHGVYRFEGDSFTNIGPDQGLTSAAIQCAFQDADGTVWLGGWTGLFRSEGERFVHITASMPWEAGE